MRRFLLGLLVTMLPATSAWAQLKDVDFRVPDKPGLLDDKALFAVPAGPPVVKPDTPLWSGHVELGTNGSDGNSNVFCLRLGGNALRQTEGNTLTADLVYTFARQNGETSSDKALFNLRDEMFFKDSPWGLFGASQLEYDQFRDYDLRVALHTGVAYQFLRTDDILLRGRIGAGASREFGETSNQWIPEGLLGGDLNWKITHGQCLVGSVDYYPDLGRPGRYRVRARAAYEIALDPACRVRLRIGIQDRYDSNPGTSLRNDLDYFTSILYKF